MHMRGLSLRFTYLKAGLLAEGQYLFRRSCSQPNPSSFLSTLLRPTAELVPRFALLCVSFFNASPSNITIIFFCPTEPLPLPKFRSTEGLQTQTSTQILNLFPLLHILPANLPSVDVLHSPALYLTPSLFVPKGQTGISR